jgi:hypothetical protein
VKAFVRTMVLAAVVAVLASCSALPAAVTGPVDECAGFLKVLRAGKAAGLSCPVYVAQARQAEPSCQVKPLRCPDGSEY